MSNTESRFIFVGENRSPKALEKNWSWEQCQREGPRLCAIKLFAALEACNLDPRKQVIVNLWFDNGLLNEQVVCLLLWLSEHDCNVIGMGRKVQAMLDRKMIPNKKLVHPAARGEWAGQQKKYNNHVRSVLLGNS